MVSITGGVLSEWMRKAPGRPHVARNAAGGYFNVRGLLIGGRNQ
jgi:hypothetical protein